MNFLSKLLKQWRSDRRVKDRRGVSRRTSGRGGEGRRVKDSRDTSYSLKYSRKKRVQHVRFRPRYASDVIRQSCQTGLNVVVLAVILFGGIWLVQNGTKFWKNSPFLRIQDIEFNKDIPPKLKSFLALHPGQHILEISTSRLQNTSLKAFPELKELSIRRQLDRTILIKGQYRSPVAYFENEKKGIDESGTVFPLVDTTLVRAPMPILSAEGSAPELKTAVTLLQKIKKVVPGFYSHITHIKTDRIGTVKIYLTDGILVYWGEGDVGSLTEKGNNVMAVLKKFSPTKDPSTLRFVENNRIVLDTNWKDLSSI